MMKGEGGMGDEAGMTSFDRLRMNGFKEVDSRLLKFV